MEGKRVASRYAKSFIGLATEQKVLENAFADMTYINDVCNVSPEFRIFLKSPIIKTDKKQEVLKQLFSGKVNKVTDAYLSLIAAKRREVYLHEIAQEFIEQYKESKKILTAVVTTAYGIDDSIRKQVMDLVKTMNKGEVVLQEQTDANIIGGFILRIGDKQVDASIARKLGKLKRTFSENPFVKEF